MQTYGDLAPLQARVAELSAALASLLTMCEHGGPEHVQHIGPCGPDRNCDCICEDAARDAKTMDAARQLLKGIPLAGESRAADLSAALGEARELLGHYGGGYPSIEAVTLGARIDALLAGTPPASEAGKRPMCIECDQPLGGRHIQACPIATGVVIEPDCGSAGRASESAADAKKVQALVEVAEGAKDFGKDRVCFFCDKKAGEHDPHCLAGMAIKALDMPWETRETEREKAKADAAVKLADLHLDPRAQTSPGDDGYWEWLDDHSNAEEVYRAACAPPTAEKEEKL
jgi:hypothetical protein